MPKEQEFARVDKRHFNGRRVKYADGHVFGRITLVRRTASGNVPRGVFKCYCGKEFSAKIGDASTGHVKSCGCWKKTKGHRFGRKGGRPLTYNSWSSMHQRCSETNKSHVKNYFNRGIKVCERWLSYDNFLADMGERPAGLNLDRINNDGNYEPGNCRWADAFVQNRNKRVRAIYREEDIQEARKDAAAKALEMAAVMAHESTGEEWRDGRLVERIRALADRIKNNKEKI